MSIATTENFGLEESLEKLRLFKGQKMLDFRCKRQNKKS